MNYDKNRKWVIEVSEEQLKLIAQCVEDCHRFAAGQCELHNTTCCLEKQDQIIDIMQYEIEPMVAPYGHGSCYGWNGYSCPNPRQRDLIAKTYPIYREIYHKLDTARGIDSVYYSPTLMCEGNGGLPLIYQKQ